MIERTQTSSFATVYINRHELGRLYAQKQSFWHIENFQFSSVSKDYQSDILQYTPWEKVF